MNLKFRSGINFVFYILRTKLIFALVFFRNFGAKLTPQEQERYNELRALFKTAIKDTQLRKWMNSVIRAQFFDIAGAGMLGSNDQEHVLVSDNRDLFVKALGL